MYEPYASLLFTTCLFKAKFALISGVVEGCVVVVVVGVVVAVVGVVVDVVGVVVVGVVVVVGLPVVVVDTDPYTSISLKQKRPVSFLFIITRT